MLTAWGKRAASVSKIVNYCIPPVTVGITSKAYIEATDAAGTNLFIPPLYHTAPSYSLIDDEIIVSGSSSTIGVAVGSGNSQESENSYKLDSIIVGLSAAVPTVETVYDDTAGEYVARLDYAISNNTGSDVTVKEIGLFVRYTTATTKGATASSSAANRHTFMIDRTVLDSPVTIPNGEARIVRSEFIY